MKTCRKCRVNKPDSEFYKNKRLVDGLYSYCKKCHYSYSKVSLRKWQKRQKTPPYQEYQRIYAKKYNRVNRKRLTEYIKKYCKQRGRIDPKFRLDKNIGSAISVSLKGEKAGQSWVKIIGYSLDKLIQRLEFQFTPQISWANYGSYWWVDHILPRSWFNYKEPEDVGFKICWSLENLQPLEKITNIKKSNKF
ncbi:MAG TPA: hypothetical protein ENH85_02900 [Candidatus Scalindua sp.]|nr:hypothetical protein [Candidatus Scalindua sp.]